MWQGIISSASSVYTPPAFVVNLSDQSVESEAVGSAATATYTLGTDGNAENNGLPIAGEWLDPVDASEADLYECYATLLSGSLSAGTTGTWQALTSDRTWTVTRVAVGIRSAQIRVEIRKIADPEIILGSAVITLTATVESGA